MIRISRGAEPEELRRARRRHLARALIALNEGKEILFADYDSGKAQLHQRQGTKCVYCERWTEMSSQPVEHFRPKDGAIRSAPSASAKAWDDDRYFWLAWTWENMVFACGSCNGQTYKGNYFPLVHGTAPLPLPPRAWTADIPATCFDLERESPMLVDPSRDNPLDHIRWAPTNEHLASAPEDLDWAPNGLTERGTMTVTILLRGGVRDHVGQHVRNAVWPRVRALRDLMGNPETHHRVRPEWDAMMRELLGAKCPFLAATHDALAYFVNAATRASFRLVLPRPGDFTVDPASTDIPDPPGFEHLPDRLKLRLRAWDEPRESLLLDVCRIRAWTVKDLAVLTGLSDSYVGDKVRGLLAAGQLTKVPSTRPFQIRARSP